MFLKQMQLVFGASADPFHQGHTQLIINAVHALEKQTGLDVSSVVILPVYRHHNIRDDIKRSLPLTYETRFAICEVAAESISEALKDTTSVSVSRLEEQIARQTNRPNFTAESLAIMRTQVDPSVEIGFLMGVDSLTGDDPSLGHWHKLNDLLSTTTLVVCPREGFEPNHDFIESLRQRGARLIFLEDVEVPDISSSGIRRRLESGEDPDNLVKESWLSRKAMDYILDNDIITIWKNLDARGQQPEVGKSLEEDDDLETRIGKLLFIHKLTLSTAESCTGGLIGHRITNVPGSSEYYIGGVVSYAYEAKVALLGVKWETLKAVGAVSPETVLEMARGIRSALNTDIGLSVSCIAGPGGATASKPVGTSWVALSTPEGDQTFHFHLTRDRIGNKEDLAQKALEVLLDYLVNLP